jgi:predicted nuclease of restriction endonuclease-like (RecB) superfamily
MNQKIAQSLCYSNFKVRQTQSLKCRLWECSSIVNWLIRKESFLEYVSIKRETIQKKLLYWQQSIPNLERKIDYSLIQSCAFETTLRVSSVKRKPYTLLYCDYMFNYIYAVYSASWISTLQVAGRQE